MAQEMVLGGIKEFTAKNDKNDQVSELVWLLTNSDEVNLNSQNINKKLTSLTLALLVRKLCDDACSSRG